jgi:hypothetical protein
MLDSLDNYKIIWLAVDSNSGQLKEVEPRYKTSKSEVDDWIVKCINTNKFQIHVFQTFSKESKSSTTLMYDPITKEINEIDDQDLKYKMLMLLQRVSLTSFIQSKTLPASIPNDDKITLENMGVIFGNKITRFGINVYEVDFPDGWRLKKSPVVTEPTVYLENNRSMNVAKITMGPFMDIEATAASVYLLRYEYEW